MKKMQNFLDLQRTTYRYSPSELVSVLGFKESLRASNAMLNNSEGNLDLRQYSVVMLENLRRTCPNEWNSSWKYDAFLGYAYFMTYDSDRTYIAYTQALTKVSPPPPQLLIEIAWCCRSPGEQPLRYEEAVFIIKQMMKDKVYLEGVDALISFYKSLKNDTERDYWEKKRNEFKDRPPPYLPYGNFLK